MMFSSRRRLAVNNFVIHCVVMVCCQNVFLQRGGNQQQQQQYRVAIVDGFSPQQCTGLGPARHNNKARIRAERNNNDNNNNRRIRTTRIGIISSQDKSTSSSSETTASINQNSLTPIEYWCTTHINVLYDRSLSMKCPFFRRRSTDILDSLYMIMKFVMIRHKSLPLIERHPPGCRANTNMKLNMKQKNLNIHDVVETIRMDWKSEESITSASTITSKQQQQQQKQLHKGYYITGRLNTTIYRDDCWFDGPDPDMPVRGVRKYLNAASQLFDTKTSTAELLSLEIGDSDDINAADADTTATTCSDNDMSSGNKKNEYQIQKYENEKLVEDTTTAKTILTALTRKITTPTTRIKKETKATIIARWRLQGVLHLPWHPSLPIWTGKTIYHLDEEHMIYRHEEYWDISVIQAFTQTLMPEVGNMIWKEEKEEESPVVAAAAVE